jgi:hypothetical protein
MIVPSDTPITDEELEELNKLFMELLQNTRESMKEPSSQNFQSYY